MELCRVEDVPPGEGTSVRSGNREIAVFNVDGTFYAIDNTCTHEGGPLGEGSLIGTTVSCPWHYASFDVTTGESLDPIAPCGVRAYPVEVENGVVKARVGPEGADG